MPTEFDDDDLDEKFRTPMDDDDYEASGLEDDGAEEEKVVDVELTDEDVAKFNEDAEG